MQFHYTVISPYAMEETLQKTEAALQEDGFGVLWRFDVAEKLQSKGLPFSHELQILEVCNPEEAHRVLAHNMMASYFLPCKIAVYTEREQVHIGMVKPTALISMLDTDELKQFAEDVERRIALAIDKVVQ
ncbi:DUF302 domain-containing protein [Ectobacillus ponti]|uniref:DUF302 domain-containing protein n=1 Tax=Ectobacillus ponti TaxID=2961894 RepID=A0AA41XCB0_9BACI|nr:DUF302 domain-containing protein [Ectobacillus ponti]MCP8969436.1 DUF302 domain-containing protein [Ectobacillus ponti]